MTLNNLKICERPEEFWFMDFIQTIIKLLIKAVSLQVQALVMGQLDDYSDDNILN